MQIILSFLKSIAFSIPYYFIKQKSNNIREKSILLIRLDAIGDYIIFRNCIEILRKSKHYKNYKITLVGNIVWKNLAEALDGKYIDSFIWINRKKFNMNLFYRYKKLKDITKYGYEIAIQPTYSREFFYGDAIIKVVEAQKKIGSMRDLYNSNRWQKKASDKYYTHLINNTAHENIFEFRRNKQFFEELLDISIEFKKPFIDIDITNMKYLQVMDEYAVLFPGGSVRFNRWRAEKFAAIADYLHKSYKYKIIICGSKNDKKIAKKIMNSSKGVNVLDLTGEITLIELTGLLSRAKILISNETSAVHIGVAVNTPVICISNGKHYGRFNPYTKKEYDKCYTIYPPEIMKNLHNQEMLKSKYRYSSRLNINTISPNEVFKKIQELLG